MICATAGSVYAYRSISSNTMAMQKQYACCLGFNKRKKKLSEQERNQFSYSGWGQRRANKQMAYSNVVIVHRLMMQVTCQLCCIHCTCQRCNILSFLCSLADLSTMEQRIQKRFYSKLTEFVADMTKIFDNCRYYNPSDSPFYQCAEFLESFFVQKLKAFKASR